MTYLFFLCIYIHIHIYIHIYIYIILYIYLIDDQWIKFYTTKELVLVEYI